MFSLSNPEDWLFFLGSDRFALRMAIMTDGRDSAKAIEKSVIAVDYSCARILPQTMAALTGELPFSFRCQEFFH